MQTVYVDLYFFINFSMDFLCFFLAARLLSQKLSLWRTLLAAALGGIYANVALFLSVSALAALLIDMAVCAILCAVALLRPHEGRRLPLFVLVYIAISMVLGGVMTALFHLFNRIELPVADTAPDGISVWLFSALALVSALLTHLCGRFFSRRTARREAILTLTFEDRVRTLSALCDTGNLLREPISGKPCVVVACERLRGFLPDDLLAAARADQTPDTTLLERYAERIRLIPAHSATGSRMLLALRVDRLMLDGPNAPHEIDAIVVLSSLADTADALIPPELLL